MVCVLTRPEHLHATGVAPFDGSDTAAPVFCCFFREVADRADLVSRLKAAAGRPPVAESDQAAETQRLSATYERHWKGGSTATSIEAAILWRALVLRREYHTYTLREGYAPYRFGVVISFAALTAAALRDHLEMAYAELDRDREEAMDMFGWGVRR
jgi:hypothetical protein